MTKKPKKTKAQQLKIAGTERRDAIKEIEDAGAAYCEARDARMEMHEDETAAQEALTAVLQKHDKTSYVYEGPDGKKYEAYLPGEVKAKVRRLKDPKPQTHNHDHGEG